MELFGVGIPEIGLIALIALVIVGPQRFPEVAREAARWYRTARSFSDAVMNDVRVAMNELEQEVTAANDGVNPIRELSDLQREIAGATQDATSTLTEATTLPAVPEPGDASAPSEGDAADAADSTGAQKAAL